ncbi:MAG TPA: hypothetical protein VHM30_11800 [Gemmatimonadaceae bacterium]|nr:hypothetical protein [Gemmatimonadaceae bacterium]
MNARNIEAGLWIAASATLAAVVIASRETASPVRATTGPISEGADTLLELDAARIGADNETVVMRDPFRASRKPSPIAFGVAGDGAALQPMPPRPPRPTLAVTGIIGPPWEAVLEGVPGREGAVVVRAGDALGELKVVRVQRDTVVVQAADTSWRLTVRRAW